VVLDFHASLLTHFSKIRVASERSPGEAPDAMSNIHQLPDGREGFSMLTSKFLIAQEFGGRLVQNDRQARIQFKMP
jgi:hypothetical protein